MRIFGFGKDKAVPFEEFRDHVRREVRRAAPQARIEPKEDGFMFRPQEDDDPVLCNLRNLYASYAKNPADRDFVVSNWLDTLVMEVPDQTWNEAKMTLRPMFRDTSYIAQANTALGKGKNPDDLPSQPFVGELHVIAMREIGSSLTGVTQVQLDQWGVGFDEVLRQALSNMGLLGFPHLSHALVAGGQTKRKNDENSEEAGLVFQGDHLTATWLVAERFRDHLSLRLGGDYIVTVPNRDKLIAIRADESGLIASITAGNRNYRSQPYPLSGQLFAVGSSASGGTVALYTPHGGQPTSVLDPNSPFTSRGGITTNRANQPLTETPAPTSALMPLTSMSLTGTSFSAESYGGAFGNSAPAPSSTPEPATPFMAPTAPVQSTSRKQPLVDLSAWGEEETDETPANPTPRKRTE